MNSTIDPEGRYIIIKVVIYNKCFTILNLYAPNNDDPDFFHRVFSELSDLSADSSLIIRSDLNLGLNTSLDRSSKCPNTSINELHGRSWNRRRLPHGHFTHSQVVWLTHLVHHTHIPNLWGAGW
uniref:Endonuclease/exonuclease/phosphatase domain-containing protein n=1 Tax=Gouania willdenowi TaxID=441366 RepID=A0A8C5G1S2_GOUWI